jgi:PAS domain-containing protein
MIGEASPLRNADGGVRGCVDAFLDITERKGREQQLRESEARFRSVVESNMLGVVFADPVSGAITDAIDEYLRMIGRTLGSRQTELESNGRCRHAVVRRKAGGFESPKPARLADSTSDLEQQI